jgi:hypothetical protein
MAGVFSAIGGIFMALSIKPLLSSYFPNKPTTGTTVRIKIGLSMYGDKDSSLGGDIPAVAVFNSNSERLGFTMGGGKLVEDSDTKVPGDIHVIHIDQKKDSFAEYISFSYGGSDVICISSVTIIIVVDDSPNFVFFGDVPIAYNVDFYVSNDVTTKDHDIYRSKYF